MNNKLIVCHTCCSTDRALISIKKIQDLLLNVNLHELIPDHGGGVCWECKRAIVKFSRFRHQVQIAQKSLQQGKIRGLKCLSNLSCSVSTTYNDCISHSTNTDAAIKLPVQLKLESNDGDSRSDHHFNDNPSVESDIYIEDDPFHNQSKEIKQEADTASDNDIFNQNYDEIKSIESVVCLEDNVTNQEIKNVKDHTQANQIRKERKNKKITRLKNKKKKRNTVDQKEDFDDIKDKFVEVEFTEEEMMKSREEKRSHPNFKKLPYNCDSCVLGFTKKENYDLHKEKKHNPSVGAHICPVCKVCFTNSTTLAKHVRKHYHSYRCKLCIYETSELWSALSHSRSKHSGDSEHSIHCKKCSYVAKCREELAAHTTSEHSLICKECGEKFKGPNTLRTHKRRIHGTARSHGCAACPRRFVSRGRLEAHAAAHGAAAAARLAYCAPCRVQYKNIYVYRNHLLNSARHTERRYHCEECGKKFASKVYYKRHYTFYHRKESNFKCELCDRLFISDWRLRHHRQTRHGAERLRSHGCDDCGKKFYTAATLRAHRLTHSGARSFLCAQCGDSFRQRPALYTHVRLVHRRRDT